MRNSGRRVHGCGVGSVAAECRGLKFIGCPDKRMAYRSRPRRLLDIASPRSRGRRTPSPNRSYSYRSEPIQDKLGWVTGHRVLRHEEHTQWVLWIFERYGEGWSPRRIAQELNALGIPSPGAKWRRSIRRTDGEWMPSALAGDFKRGIGILNNELYRGIRVWIRTQRWKSDPDTGQGGIQKAPGRGTSDDSGAGATDYLGCSVGRRNATPNGTVGNSR